MTALLGLLAFLLLAGVPGYMLGVYVGRRLERRDRRRQIARAHRRPPRAPARTVIREARAAVGAGHASREPGLALVAKPAFGDRPAGNAWDCFSEEDR